MTWETCTLRKWLNNDFLNACFDIKTQGAIQTTTVDNSSSQCYSGWSTSGGNDTQDRIFLLSYAEANQYFGVTSDNKDNTEARVLPTAYAKAQGAYTSTSNSYTVDSSVYGTTGAAGYWWLRSPGFYRDYAANVYVGGSLGGSSVNFGDTCVRPALWVNLNAIQ